MTLYQKLKWFLLSGITETISETPQNRFKTSPAPTTLPIHPATDLSFLEQAKTLAMNATTLTDLYAARASFQGCPLKNSAQHTLNGFGAPHPTVLCLLDTPNTDDEKTGQLLAGSIGQKFHKMIGSIQLDLAHNTYVSTLIPWRPPGNRKPTETEFSVCRPFWEKEIALLQPKILLLFGSSVCQQILGITAFIRACQSEHTFTGIPTFVCPTPTSVSNDSQNYRRLAWQVLQQVQKHL